MEIVKSDVHVKITRRASEGIVLELTTSKRWGEVMAANMYEEKPYRSADGRQFTAKVPEKLSNDFHRNDWLRRVCIGTNGETVRFPCEGVSRTRDQLAAATDLIRRSVADTIREFMASVEFTVSVTMRTPEIVEAS